MTKGDGLIILLVFVIALIAWTSYRVIPAKPGEVTAVVRVFGEEVARLPASGPEIATKEIALQGGIATVEYGQGKVRIVPFPDSYCPNGICWKTGWISRKGQSIVCVPNRMTISLEGGEGGVDSVVR